MNIKDESIKLFIQLIQQEKVSIPIEHYKDFYVLSEFFNIPKFILSLDKIRKQELYEDLNFTIQILIDLKKEENEIETNLMSEIESFLSSPINECIINKKFGELPVSTIYRIIDRSDIENINQNSFFDFILESTDNRFILFKFFDIHKLTDEKKFFDFVEEQQKNSKEWYLNYITFNISYIQQMKNKYEIMQHKLIQTNKEHESIKQVLNQTKEEHENTKQELNQIKKELENIMKELRQKKEECENTKQELEQTKEEHENTKQELNQIKEEHENTKQELNQIKREHENTKQELNQIKKELENTMKELRQKKRM